MNRNRDRGYSLIELMIVVVVVALIATLAYPSYQESVRKAKRAEGRTALMQLMQQQERYYTQHGTFVPFSSASDDAKAKLFKWHSGETPLASAYEINGAACAESDIGDCIILTAIPGTGKVNSSYSDAKCGKLTYSSTGRKSADGVGCW